MPIIIKKKVVAEAPAPIVEPEEKVEARQEPTPVVTDYRSLPIANSLDELWANRGKLRAPDPTECKLCGNSYAFPCHGKAENCMSAKWAREKA
ncbi:hypothetical protein KXR64_14200 [Brucella intermedia]|uniref:hypothetical protein n=1 Tax=Brucella TaxID=234 RepID=UPI0011152E06|nr:hypothetical protein [Brucella intermedia]